MARPFLAEVRGGQKPIDLLGVGLRRVVFEEGFDFFGAGSESCEVEAQAPEKRSFVGGRGGLPVFCFQRERMKRS